MRVKSAESQRQMLRAALMTSSDSIAQAQAGLEAEKEGRSPGDSVLNEQGAKGDPMSEALRACALAEQAAAAARECLEKPLTADQFRAEHDDATGGEERLVEAAQAAATKAEQAAARLVERLGQIRGIRAKLRSLLGHLEARFRRASAALADGGVSDADKAMHVASKALAVARDRLRSSLGSGYLIPGGGADGGGDSGSGSLARDEEAVSEASGFVEALELFASRDVTPASPERSSASASSPEPDSSWPKRSTPSASNPGSGNEALDALALALKWGDALRAQVSELQLGSDPAVSQAVEAARKAARAAENLWSPGDGSAGEGRAAVEGLAAQLGELEKVAESAAGQRRAREAGLWAAAKRLDRLTATLGSLKDTVELAGEPLLVSLTSAALKTASDVVAAASAATGGSGVDSADIRTAVRDQGSTFTDAVQAAAVAVAQAEATVARARERAPQVSAERVRALETLVKLAETLSEAGEQLASSSQERGLPSSRKAAAAILEAQEGLSRARAAAQVDGGAWISGGAAIAEAVAEAGELVRRAKRAADPPTVVRPTSPTGPAGTSRATDEDVVAAEANARAWLEEEGGPKGGGEAGGRSKKKPPASAKGAQERSTPKGTTDARKARIGFSKNGEDAKAYLPLWMRLQKKMWQAGGAGKDGASGSDDSEQVEASQDSSTRYEGLAGTERRKSVDLLFFSLFFYPGVLRRG